MFGEVMKTRTKDAVLCAQAAGDAGSVVVALHGLGDTAQVWSGATEGLQSAHRVIAPDLRGCGESERGTADYSLAQLADDTIALLDVAGVDNCHLVGHSLGGVIAQELLTRFPQRFLSAVLISSSNKVGEKATRSWLRLAEVVEARGEVHNSPETAERGFSTAFAAAHPDVIAAKAEAASRSDAAVYAAQARAASSYDYTAALAAYHEPVLILQGKADRITPIGGSVLLSRAFPNATLELLEDTGHNVPTEMGPRLGERITRFIADIGSARGQA